jgi:hypothetical protein
MKQPSNNITLNQHKLQHFCYHFEIQLKAKFLMSPTADSAINVYQVRLHKNYSQPEAN